MLWLLLLPLIPASPLPTPTLPSPGHAPSYPSPTLAPRCNGEGCEFGGSATTLQASVVTSTILSVTSVPCYITTTTYITDSTTITTEKTIYSTETITSTVTSEGTVYIVKYQPTPILMSAPYETVIKITHTLMSYWTEQSGSEVASTFSSKGRVMSGGLGPTSQPAQPQLGDAWTHKGGAGGNTAIYNNDNNGWSFGGNAMWSSGMRRRPNIFLLMLAILVSSC